MRKDTLYSRALKEVEASKADAQSLYVFGYGSLMWNPCFPYLSSESGRIYGYCRRLAVFSHHYRGTPQRPGLVFGLDSGGCCNGMLYHVAIEDKVSVIDYLFEREMFAHVYFPRFVRVHTEKQVRLALTFIVHRSGKQYAPPMAVEKSAEIIRMAHGKGGANVDYIYKTREMLGQLNIPCVSLDKLCQVLKNG